MTTKYDRVYNFSAGPSMLPLEVLEKVQASLLNYEGSGQSVMEMSHRSKEFKKIAEDAEANLRKLMNIPDNYKVLFLQGGGTLQFSMVPLNLLKNSKKADYIVTGTWAKKAYKEATKFGDIKVAASSEADTFTWIPKVKKEDIRPDADYVYFTDNNTIYGTEYKLHSGNRRHSSGFRHVIQHSVQKGGRKQIWSDLGRCTEECGPCRRYYRYCKRRSDWKCGRIRSDLSGL